MRQRAVPVVHENAEVRRDLRNDYRDLAEAHASIHEFLEKVYNHKRLHSALGYMPPAECEAQLKAQRMEAAARQLVA